MTANHSPPHVMWSYVKLLETLNRVYLLTSRRIKYLVSDDERLKFIGKPNANPIHRETIAIVGFYFSQNQKFEHYLEDCISESSQGHYPYLQQRGTK